MSEEKLDMDKLKRTLRDSKFLNRVAKYYTVERQMDKVEEECDKLGVDVRDTFHVVGTEKKGDMKVLHIVTSGKEGEESAKRTMREVAEAVEDVDIENQTAKRYDEVVDEKLITKMIHDKLEKIYPGYRKKYGIKEGE